MGESNKAPNVMLALSEERARIAAAMQQCETLAAEVWMLRKRCAELEVRTEIAEQTVAAMRRSWFWRARLVWVAIRTRARRVIHNEPPRDSS